jgi:hypothetical protein
MLGGSAVLAQSAALMWGGRGPMRRDYFGDRALSQHRAWQSQGLSYAIQDLCPPLTVLRVVCTA